MIYLDNAATSFPKPREVPEAVYKFMTEQGTNVNRGTYSKVIETENTVYETRELLADFFNFDKPENVAFTKNITESLNILIKGLLKENDHVIVSSMEHNAVMRPLSSLKNKNISFSRIPCQNEDGTLLTDEIYKLIRPDTRAVIMTNASNVCGTIMDLYRVGKICREKNICFIVDSAQTAGSHSVDMKEINADAVAFTGHKGLLGPQGIGGLLVNDRINKVLSPLIEGGTGSRSEYEEQPSYMPDKFEGGTLNIPGIFGLNAALKYINKRGIDDISEQELYFTDKLIQGLNNIRAVRVVGKQGIKGRTSCVSIDIPDEDLGIISYRLSNEFGIMQRCGLHCAPSAHKTLGTFPKGTIRFSIGPFNSGKDITGCIERNIF